MTIKSLLLGSAAAVAVVGGAQAADLSVAEPVEYVKVCDYFGAGYWYIPGTDTCIKISGYVEENALFHANESVSTAVVGSFGPFTFYGSHTSSWNMNTVVQLDVDTKSETEYGVLEGLVSFGGGNHGGGRGDTYGLGDDGAFVSLGGFKAGSYQLAAYVPGIYAFTDNNGPYNNEIYGTFGYDLLNTVQASWSSGGISASIALSDPSTSPFFNYGVIGPVAKGAPLITGNVGFGTKDVTFNVSGGFISNDPGYGSNWGVDGQAHFNLGPANSFELNAAYGGNTFIQNGWGVGGPDGYGDLGTNNGYSFLGGWQHTLSKSLAFQLVGSWAKFSGTDLSGYAINADLVWTPVTNFSVTGAVVYSKNTGAADFSSAAWVASLSVKRSW